MPLDISDFKRFKTDMQSLTENMNAYAPEAVYTAATEYAADVIKCPATPVDTGQYRASIRADNPVVEGGGPVSYVGSPMPQTLRLEYGFIGTDSLGRVYHQPPRPHWRPTFDFNLGRYMETMKRILGRVKP